MIRGLTLPFALCAFFGGYSHAATVQVASTNVPPGATFLLPLTVDSGTNVLGRYDVDISYDSAVVKVLGVQAVGGQFNAVFFSTNTPGRVFVSGENLSSLTAPTGLVTVAQLNLQAVGANGTGCVLGFHSAHTYNTLSQTLPTTTVPGAVSVFVQQATVQVGSTNVTVGTAFSVSLTLNVGAVPLGRYDVEIGFNPSVLTATGVSGGVPEFATPLYFIDPSGRVVITDENLLSLTSPTGTVFVASLDFIAIGAPGSGSPLTLSGISIFDTDAHNIPFIALPGTVGIGGWTAAVRLASTNVPAGTTFTLPITVDSGTNVLGRYDALVSFNPGVLRILNVAGGAGAFSSPIFSTNLPGQVTLSDENLSSLSSPTGSVLVAQLTFVAIGPPGSSSPLEFEVVTLLDVNAQALPVTSYNAVASIAGLPVIIQAGSTNVPRFADFSVPVTVDSGNTVLGSYIVEIQYDTNVVRIAGVLGGSAFFGSPMFNTNTPGRVIIGDENLVSLDSPTGVVQVALLNFNAAGPSFSSAALSPGPSTAFDTDAHALLTSNLTGIVNVDFDTDGDGMADWFEQTYFGGTTNGVANVDSDGDGFPNDEEFRAGTSPMDPASVLRIVAVEKLGNDVRVSFTTTNHRQYRLEWASALGGPWNLVEQKAGSGGVVPATDAGGAAQPKRFYRIWLVQP